MIFNSSYNDKLLEKEARNALEEKPTLRGLSIINVTANNGVVNIFGTVRSEKLKKDIEETIIKKYEVHNIEYKEIKNDLSI